MCLLLSFKLRSRTLKCVEACLVLTLCLLPQVAWSNEAELIFEAKFDSAPDGIVSVGGTARFATNPDGEGEISINEENLFGGGNSLHTVVRTVEEGQSVEMIPAGPEHSLAAWAEKVDGQWRVAGALDFFFESDQEVKRMGTFLPLKAAAPEGGLRLQIRNIPETDEAAHFVLVLEGPPNAFGNGERRLIVRSVREDTTSLEMRNLTQYHLGLAILTDLATGLTTVRLYARSDTAAIEPFADDDLVGSATFELNSEALTGDHFFSPGPFFFGNIDSRSISQLTLQKEQFFDELRIYRGVPATFPAVGE